MHPGIVADLVVFLAIAVVVTPLCHRLKVSPILGYLAAGVAAGRTGLMTGGVGAIALADLGVAFLLFMIGLELSLERLKVIRNLVFGLGSAQLLVVGGLAGVTVWGLGLAPRTAMVLGIALAFSSTAFVLQSLAERGELGSRTGRVAVAVLILQDLAVVPLLVMIPRLGGDGASVVLALAESLAKAVAAMAAIWLVARLALRPFFHLVAATRSPEAFVAAALLAVIGTSAATEAAGLSYVLGAFLAGVMLASTEYRHQIEADLQPVRGLLMGLFFLTVGMTVDLGVLAERLPAVLGATAGLLAAKAVVMALLALAFRFPPATAIQLGLLLAQGGEFAMVVAERSRQTGLLDGSAADLVTAVVALSMAATPLLAAAGDWVVRRHRLAGAREHAPGEVTREMEGHVIVCGYGRVGRLVASVLADRGIAVVAIDRDPRRVAQLRARGEPVFFGDIRNLDVLKAVGASRARAVVVTISAGSSREKLVLRLRHQFPSLHVLVRAHDLAQARALAIDGASAVVPETLEGSLQLAGQALRQLGLPVTEVAEVLEDYRRGDYARLQP